MATAPGEWLCRTPQLTHFSARIVATASEPGVRTHFMCGLIGGEREEGAKGRQSVCGHIPSSLATPFITLLSQLQTKPQCGASLLKSQHDKNSRIEVAQPTLPWHMGYFLVCVVELDCGQALRLLNHYPDTSRPARSYQ